MKEFSHIGIPTSVVQPNEIYIEGGKLYVTDFNLSESKIEWLRFEEDSPLPEQLKTIAHVAFEVDDIDQALAGKEILIEPFEPMEGIKVAFILDEGAPVEFMQKI
ncbi:MAG: VOC family protein [Puniceicoccaceae bacterium]